MKAKFVAIATISLAGCTTYPNTITTSALAGEDEILPSCEQEWAGNYSMIALCVERQTRGFRDVQRLLEEHNIRNGDTTPEAKIFADCSREWQGYIQDQPNWPMIALCFERQWAGYRKLYLNE